MNLSVNMANEDQEIKMDSYYEHRHRLLFMVCKCIDFIKDKDQVCYYLAFFFLGKLERSYSS